jgi:hypothetical protein
MMLGGSGSKLSSATDRSNVRPLLKGRARRGRRRRIQHGHDFDSGEPPPRFTRSMSSSGTVVSWPSRARSSFGRNRVSNSGASARTGESGYRPAGAKRLPSSYFAITPIDLKQQTNNGQTNPPKRDRVNSCASTTHAAPALWRLAGRPSRGGARRDGPRLDRGLNAEHWRGLCLQFRLTLI